MPHQKDAEGNKILHDWEQKQLDELEELAKDVKGYNLNPEETFEAFQRFFHSNSLSIATREAIAKNPHKYGLEYIDDDATGPDAKFGIMDTPTPTATPTPKPTLAPTPSPTPTPTATPTLAPTAEPTPSAEPISAVKRGIPEMNEEYKKPIGMSAKERDALRMVRGYSSLANRQDTWNEDERYGFVRDFMTRMDLSNAVIEEIQTHPEL
jgi:hypothetical protein